MSTGITLGRYSTTEPYERLHAWQIEGGLPGFDDFTRWFEKWATHDFEDTNIMKAVFICERFTPRRLLRSYRSEELEPLRVEGFLMAKNYMPMDYKQKVWRAPSYQVLVKGENAAESKKFSNQLLKDGGLWLTGKSVSQKDAHDAISSTKHALAYLKQQKHQPTIEKYWNV